MFDQKKCSTIDPDHALEGRLLEILAVYFQVTGGVKIRPGMFKPDCGLLASGPQKPKRRKLRHLDIRCLTVQPRPE